MKKVKLLSILFTLLTVLLLGCNAHSPAVTTDPPTATDPPIELTPVFDTWTMNFPGTAWGMTPEEVCQALELDEAEYEERKDSSPYSITNVRMNLFGEDAHITFGFEDQNSDGVYTLSSAQVVYPQKADMAAVKTVMQEWYGDPAESQEAGETLWESEALGQDIMTEAEAEYLRTQNSMAQTELTTPITTIRWTTNFHSIRPLTLDGLSTTNVLTFQSGAAFYTKEGGFTSQLEAENAE